MAWGVALLLVAIMAYAVAWCLTTIITGLWDVYRAADARARLPDPDAGPTDPLQERPARGGWDRP